MDFSVVLDALEQYWSQIALFLLGLNFWAKLGRVKKLARAAIEASRDGKLDDAEKVVLWDEAWSVIKGFFPNRSK